MRYFALVLTGVLLGACTSPTTDSPAEPTLDTLSRYNNGTPKTVTLQKGDSVLERRRYRHTGTLLEVTRGDSVQTYLDLHNPDSAAILRDYLQGRWRNLSADTSRDQESAFYIFEEDRLTFENPSRSPLESVGGEYKTNRTLTTETGMSVRAKIAAFDTVRVTGYTLVRLPPPDSL